MNSIQRNILSILAMGLFFQPLQIIAQQHYFVFLNTNPGREQLAPSEVEKIQKAHLANIDSLVVYEEIVAAGPFDGGGGLFILNVPDIQYAYNVVNTDPAVQAKRFITEIYPMDILRGNICKPDKDYEMVTYQFVRFIPVEGGVKNDMKVEDLTSSHEAYLTDYEKNDCVVIVDGFFGVTRGGFLIINNEEQQAVEKNLQQDPYITSGAFRFEIKPLWIAKGTFCEK